MFLSIIFFFTFYCLSLSEGLSGWRQPGIFFGLSSILWTVAIADSIRRIWSPKLQPRKITTRISKPIHCFFFGNSEFIWNLNNKKHPTADFFEFGHHFCQAVSFYKQPEVLSWPEIWQWKVGLETQPHCWVVVFWMKKGWLHDNFMLKLH